MAEKMSVNPSFQYTFQSIVLQKKAKKLTHKYMLFVGFFLFITIANNNTSVEKSLKNALENPRKKCVNTTNGECMIKFSFEYRRCSGRDF